MKYRIFDMEAELGKGWLSEKETEEFLKQIFEEGLIAGSSSVVDEFKVWKDLKETL